jgi:hypothetical protein
MRLIEERGRRKERGEDSADNDKDPRQKKRKQNHDNLVRSVE